MGILWGKCVCVHYIIDIITMNGIENGVSYLRHGSSGLFVYLYRLPSTDSTLR